MGVAVAIPHRGKGNFRVGRDGQDGTLELPRCDLGHQNDPLAGGGKARVIIVFALAPPSFLRNTSLFWSRVRRHVTGVAVH